MVANFVQRVRRRAHADPLRALQQRSEVLDAARSRARAGCDARRDGPLRARRRSDSDGRWLLRRGADPDKDQSYFLFSLTQEQLARRASSRSARCAKPQVREQARRLGLQVADKPDSQEICFVPDGDYAAFVASSEPAVARAGAIVDESGRTLGAHGGVHRFTVGQRKGLGDRVADAALRAEDRRRSRDGHRRPAQRRWSGPRSRHRG